MNIPPWTSSPPAPRRVGVIGDVHGCDDALVGLLRFFGDQSLDALWCVGDIADGPGDIDACVSLLTEHDVLTVRGNHDRWLLTDAMRQEPQAHSRLALWPASREFLEQTPLSATFETSAGLDVVLCHGLGDDDMDNIGPGDYGYGLEVNERLGELLADGRPRIVVKGHTHRYAVWQLETLTLVNAGTLLHYSDVCGVILELSADTRVTWVRRAGDSFELGEATRIPLAGRALDQIPGG
jgi:predicted phosphodiesterase